MISCLGICLMVSQVADRIAAMAFLDDYTLNSFRWLVCGAVISLQDSLRKRRVGGNYGICGSLLESREYRSVNIAFCSICSMISDYICGDFAGYYHISDGNSGQNPVPIWKCWPLRSRFLISGIIVVWLFQIENQAGHYQLYLGTIPSHVTYISKLGF